ncbi:MAG: BolA family protein [Alphaproteobacteria bacterium]
MMQERLANKLNEALHPLSLIIEDESNLHFGHAGYRPEGETHFKVTLVSDQFSGMERIARHRLVHQILKEELQTIHALVLILKSPEEINY